MIKNNRFESKYDTYGRLKTDSLPDIKKGNVVCYISTFLIGSGNRKKSARKLLVGTWDGEKVKFNDNENTIVRTTRWLNKYGGIIERNGRRYKNQYKIE